MTTSTSFSGTGSAGIPKAKIEDIVHDYSHYFISAALADDFSKGLMDSGTQLEGPLATNDGVDRNTGAVQSMEKRATPQDKLNWRFQQALYRAYYDAFVRKRLAIETIRKPGRWQR